MVKKINGHRIVIFQRIHQEYCYSELSIPVVNTDKIFFIISGFEICPRSLAVQLDLSTLHNSLSNFFLILSKTGNEITTFKRVFLNLGIFLLQYFLPILWTVNLSSQVIGQARIYNFQVTLPRN